MTSTEFKKINSILKAAYLELGIDDISILSEEYKEVVRKIKIAILDKYDFTEDEYEAIQEKISSLTKEGLFSIIENTKEKIKNLENKHIPTSEEIEEIANKVAKKYVVEPQITNQIIKEYTIEKPQIIETTRIINKEFNPSKIEDKISNLHDKINKIEIPDLDKAKEELRSEFQEKLENNINILDMPNFRKLAMGLRADIDRIDNESSGLTILQVQSLISIRF